MLDDNSRKDSFSIAEMEAMKTVNETRKYDGVRYEVGIPWKNNEPKLDDNYALALKRLTNIENTLTKSENLARQYSQTFQKYEEKGYIRKVPEAEARERKKWYLPHFSHSRRTINHESSRGL